jgi:hypothetical protein
MSRQTVVVKDGKRVEPANLDFLPREYRGVQPLRRAPDKYDEMAKRLETKTTGGQNAKTQTTRNK